VAFFLENYELDVLQKNSFGRSVLTDAFQSGNTDIIALCLSHSSSTEERLLAVDDPSATCDSATCAESNTPNESNEVIHEFDFTPLAVADFSDPTMDPTPAPRIRKTLRIRELPITRADNPFGSEVSPEDDTTGLGIWPSAVLMARYAVEMQDLLRGQVVVELGCGCGIPGLAVARYCEAKRVYLTDIHLPTIENLHHNLAINESLSGEGSGEGAVICQVVNWGDAATFPAEPADVIIGSDLVYDSGILAVLVPAVAAMLREGGHFLYVAPDHARAGMADLVSSLAQHRVHCVGHVPAPDS
jgi:predicted nicotinamide N-methyase